MWLCQREEASKNEHVSVMFSLSPAYLLGEHLGAVKHRVASPKCRAAHSSSCPIIYCPSPNLPPPLGRPPPPSPQLLLILSRLSLPPAEDLKTPRQESHCLSNTRHHVFYVTPTADRTSMLKPISCQESFTVDIAHDLILVSSVCFSSCLWSHFLSSRGDMVCFQSLLLFWLI